MKCTKCGAEIANGNKFCMECGAPVSEENKLICKKCGMGLPPNARFCFGCGSKIEADSETKVSKTSSGLNMGDKNVVAGDIKGEEYNIGGNATIIRNEDETKKVLTCHHCGKNIPVVEGFTCQCCGEFVCKDCFDSAKGICKDCASGIYESKEEQYKSTLKTALLDGKIDAEERQNLDTLIKNFGISQERAKKIEDEVRGNTSSDLTAVDNYNINHGLELYYEEGKVKEALALVEPVFEKHSTDETAVSAYLTVLAEIDSDKAKAFIENLHVDYLQANLTLIDICLQKGDYANAETKIQQTKKLWFDKAGISYREVLYFVAMYKKTLKEEFNDKAKNALVTFQRISSKLDRTLFYKAEALIENNLPSEETIKTKDLYVYLSSKDPFKKAVDEIKGAVNMVLVQGSEFTMGKNETAHKASVNDFYIAKTQVTQELYESVMHENPSKTIIVPNHPVENVSFYDALVFCNLLSERDGLNPCYTVNGTTNLLQLKRPTEADSELWANAQCDFSANGYRLPTEAEWEYAARGGLQQKNFTYSGTNTLDSIGWYSVNSGKTTKPVASLAPNQLGIYDMCGNVWEMCWDISGSGRIRRGGSWMNDAPMCTVLTKSTALPFRRFNINGIRLFKSN